MRRRSSSRGRNTSASVTVTVVALSPSVHHKPLDYNQFQFCLVLPPGSIFLQSHPNPPRRQSFYRSLSMVPGSPCGVHCSLIGDGVTTSIHCPSQFHFLAGFVTSFFTHILRYIFCLASICLRCLHACSEMMIIVIFFF